MAIILVSIWGLNFELWHFPGVGFVVVTVRCMYKCYMEIGNAMPQVCKGEI